MSTDLNRGNSPPCITARRGGWVNKEILRSHRNRRGRGGFPLRSQSENHPVLALAEASRLLFCRSATPPCGDARRGIALIQINAPLQRSRRQTLLGQAPRGGDLALPTISHPLTTRHSRLPNDTHL